MNNRDDEMSNGIKKKFEIQRRAYKELDDIKKELEKLRKKIQQTNKNPLAPPQNSNSPAEEID